MRRHWTWIQAHLMTMVATTTIAATTPNEAETATGTAVATGTTMIDDAMHGTTSRKTRSTEDGADVQLATNTQMNKCPTKT